MSDERQTCPICGRSAVPEALQCSNCGHTFTHTRQRLRGRALPGQRHPLLRALGIGCLSFMVTLWVLSVMTSGPPSHVDVRARPALPARVLPTGAIVTAEPSLPAARHLQLVTDGLTLQPDAKVRWVSGCTISGEVRNDTGRHLSYVRIRFDLRDEHGARVDRAFADTTDLQGGATWHFETFALQTEDAEKVEVAELIGY